MESKPKLLLLLFLSVALLLVGKPDPTCDKSALLALPSVTDGRSLLWNFTEQSPYNWACIQCKDNRATALSLPSVALSDEVYVGILGNMTRLYTLSLCLNILKGQLPTDLSQCMNLCNLYLHAAMEANRKGDVINGGSGGASWCSLVMLPGFLIFDF